MRPQRHWAKCFPTSLLGGRTEIKICEINYFAKYMLMNKSDCKWKNQCLLREEIKFSTAADNARMKT